MATSFSINYDYRCPFARNANEHLITALRDGAPYDVTFKTFSQIQGADEGTPPVWDDPDKRRDLMSVAAGIVVRDRFPEHFFDVHLTMFSLRHDEGEDTRRDEVVRAGLERNGVDADAVFAELADGWPYQVFRAEHEESIKDHQVFGVPTFVADDDAVFVRLMTRPAGDAAVARATIDRVIELLTEHPEVNEYKHTTVPF